MILRLFHDIPMWAKAFAASLVLMLSLIGLGTNAYLTMGNSAQGLADLSATNLPKQNAVSGVTHDVITTHVKIFRYVTWASNSVSPALLQTLNGGALPNALGLIAGTEHGKQRQNGDEFGEHDCSNSV